MHDGTARVQPQRRAGQPDGAHRHFSEEVVCPAEQVVKIRKDLPFAACRDHRLQRGDRHRRRDPPRAGRRPGRACWWSAAAASASISCRAPGSPARAPIIACDLLDNKLDYAKRVRRHRHDQRARSRATCVKRVQRIDRRARRRLSPSMRSAARRPRCRWSTRSRRAAARCWSASRPFRRGRRSRLARWSMVEKTVSGTYYGSVRPNIDFPMLADLDMDEEDRPRRPDQPHLPVRRDQRRAFG